MITTSLRLDEETYNYIVSLATKEERSINSQMVYMLKKYLEQLKNTNNP